MKNNKNKNKALTARIISLRIWFVFILLLLLVCARSFARASFAHPPLSLFLFLSFSFFAFLSYFLVYFYLSLSLSLSLSLILLWVPRAAVRTVSGLVLFLCASCARLLRALRASFCARFCAAAPLSRFAIAGRHQVLLLLLLLGWNTVSPRSPAAAAPRALLRAHHNNIFITHSL